MDILIIIFSLLTILLGLYVGVLVSILVVDLVCEKPIKSIGLDAFLEIYGGHVNNVFLTLLILTVGIGVYIYT